MSFYVVAMQLSAAQKPVPGLVIACVSSAQQVAPVMSK